MADKEKKINIGKIGYYSVVAFSLLVIGGVSWFTVSRLGALNNITGDSDKKSESSYSEKSDTYNKKEKKDDDTKKATEPSTEVAESVPQVPYTEQPTQTPEYTMPVTGAVIKPFSNTSLQYSKTYGDMRIHEAIDIKCDEGTPVLSAADGTVTDVFDDAALGKVITVDHGSGISVKYCGLKTVAVVKGGTVKSGDTLGTSGTVPCECKDEPHIHLEAADEAGLNSILALFGIGE